MGGLRHARFRRTDVLAPKPDDKTEVRANLITEMQMDPVIATSPIEIGMADDIGRDLPSLAGGRPLVIDYFASRHAGLTVGDITVAFADAPLEPRYIEILPVAGVRILAERHLIGLLADGASLAWAPHLMGRHLAIRLARPECWIAFLESHPRNR